MLQLFLVVVLLMVLLVLPVLLAAHWVGAKRASLGYAVLAVVLQVLLASVIQALVPDDLLAVILILVLGAMLYAQLLQTTPLRGFLIGFISLLIEVVFLLLVAGFLVNFA